ncbi:MAG TPA: N-6 DNA methylase [Gemmatimonas sp.]|uniref:Eco57I restriction-modification methylase domain-containing protein n=1 Tax=Gemmatimonas sp. TaxID=1962908 RepID=UPI002ED7E605
MLTLRAAALLLARADSHSALRPLAPLLGFSAPPIPVPAAIRRDLGLQGLVQRAELCEGPGALRLLTAQLTPPDSIGDTNDLREHTRKVAAALARHAPTRQWVLCTIDAQGHALCLATVNDTGAGTRVAALRIDRRRVLDSDADTFRTLAAAANDDHLLRHARFTDILRRDALSLRFYRAIEQAVDTLAQSLAPSGRARSRTTAAHTLTPAQRRELALLCISRCLFLGFLEAKGWLDHRRDFLLHHTLRVLESGGSLHERLLRPLFFGTLNTPRRARAATARLFGRVPFLNGGLFSPTALERRARSLQFSDDALTALITGVLDRYRFTAHEDSAAWSEAAVDPEMLGRAFESLMAADERRRSGAFYTPPHLVDTAISEGLTALLPTVPATVLEQAADAPLAPDVALTITHRLTTLRVLDPACGSGAFLVRTLERLDALLRRAGDQRPTHERRRALLTHNIFGVDRDPMAVWLCELRLWLAVVIECDDPDIERIAPLPNLDHHIRVGDSLAGGSFRFAPPSGRALSTLRARYSRASGARKVTIASALDLEERRRSVAELSSRLDAVGQERRQLLLALRSRDLFGQRTRATRSDRARLTTLRTTSRELSSHRSRLQLGAALPFRFGAMFADVGAAQGFGMVVGNPPWVRPHAMPERERQWLRQEFRAMRHAGWRAGATRAGAGAGFAAQADLAVAFVERSIQLLAPNGILALLVPAKLWRTLAGGGIRRLLQQETHLKSIHDWSDAPAQFDAATYPSLVVAERRTSIARHDPARFAEMAPRDVANEQPVRITLVRESPYRFQVAAPALSLDGDPDAPWLLLPSDAHSAFQRIRDAGTPLALSQLGRPLLGVKCGCNAAFLVHALEHDDHSATVTALTTALPRQGVIERQLLRPALRGESVRDPFRAHADDSAESADLRIIWTHGLDGSALPALPTATHRWLAQWRPRLHARRDARHTTPWWALFRTESARSDAPRVVWADIGKRLRTQVLLAGDPTVPLNSCYVMRVRSEADAFALHALLQSTIAAAWLDPLAEPARGGFRRFLGWTVASLPLPANWPTARRLLAPLGQRLHNGQLESLPQPAALDATVAAAYGLTVDQLQPLLDWYRHA